MKQSLQLKMGQQLTMTPQLQQAIRLPQLSTLDLQQEIQEAFDSNPILEVEEPHDGGPTHSNDATNTTSTQERESEPEPTAPTADGEDSGEWNESIPDELPVDTSWDDIYQSAPTSSGPEIGRAHV